MVEDEKELLLRELAAVWSAVRKAFAEYRLDDALPYLNIPPDEPRPSRADAAALAEFLPDIDRARIIGLEREADVAAIVADTSQDPGETEVTVFRFRRSEEGWKIFPAPHSCSSVSVEKTDEAGFRRILADDPTLGVIPKR